MRKSTPVNSPPILWRPPDTGGRLRDFASYCAERFDQNFEGYDDLWQWSIRDLSGFWTAVWDYFDVCSSEPPRSIVSGVDIATTRWFDGALLNYAEHALLGEGPGPAIIGCSDSRDDIVMSWDELRQNVAEARSGLIRLGVGPGDRVASYLPNMPETIVAFLATASIGAIWTSCSPEFGPSAVIDRFAQVTPKVLFAVTGYHFGNRRISREVELEKITASLESLTSIVLVPYGEFDGSMPKTPNDMAAIRWDQFLTNSATLEFRPVETSHPLYILYSSGTTGLPKAIVHGHGGILLEHLKVLGLHAELGPADRFMWFTTTGWMMWNYLVSGLLHGATIITADIDPAKNGPSTLWQVAADLGVTWLGLGAPYITSGMRSHIKPGRDFDLRSLRAVGSTGSPLPSLAYHWVHNSVGESVHLSSISGGTDICSAFVGGSPMTPVWAGEISCRYLGAAVEAFDPLGRSLVGTQGELVVTEPMPSMPVGFWGDSDGSKYRSTYFDRFSKVWTHGDWITLTSRGSAVISGRSDATLNRAGIRVGTAEIYSALEAIEEVVDSLIVHVSEVDGNDKLVLFVHTDDQRASQPNRDALAPLIRETIRQQVSPRHVPDEIHFVSAIPKTLSGKKPEIPIKRILMGAEPETAISRESLEDPGALDAIIQIAAIRQSSTETT